MRKTRLFCIVLAVCALCSAPALAQDDEGLDLWDLEGDVDEDGVVSATDIQHVINRALDLPTSDPNVALRPIRRYAVASPRASLCIPGLGATDAAAGDLVPPMAVGAAHNFPRDDGRIMLIEGAAVVFLLDWNIEGVWYPHACGLLSAQFVLEAARPTEDGSIPEEWVVLGHDGAAGRRCGPSIGTARIHVRHQFDNAGDYLLRAKILTKAIPSSDVDPASGNLRPVEPGNAELDTTEPLPAGSAVAYDEVYVHVRVVEVEPDETDVLEWQDVPEGTMSRHGDAMPHEMTPVEPPRRGQAD